MREGWTEAVLRDACEVNPRSRGLPERFRYVDIGAVTWERGIDLTCLREISKADAPSRAQRHLMDGDVLVSMVRPNLRAMAVVPESLDGHVASTGFVVIRAQPEHVLPGFIWALVRLQSTTDALVNRATGSNYPAAKESDIASLRVLLPPLAEQRRIVDLIQELDAYAASLDAVEGRARRARNAAVHHHFSGSVDGDRRVAPLGDLINLKRGFDLPASQRGDGSIPVVSSAGRTGTHSVAKVDGPAVVIGRYGTLGQVHLVDEPCWPLNTTLYVESFGELEPPYVALLLETLDLTGHGVKSAVPGVNRNTLHGIPVSIEAQAASRRQFSDRVTEMAGVISAVATVRGRTHQLRASLLTDLLSGRHAIAASYDRFLDAA